MLKKEHPSIDSVVGDGGQICSSTTAATANNSTKLKSMMTEVFYIRYKSMINDNGKCSGSRIPVPMFVPAPINNNMNDE